MGLLLKPVDYGAPLTHCNRPSPTTWEQPEGEPYPWPSSRGMTPPLTKLQNGAHTLTLQSAFLERYCPPPFHWSTCVFDDFFCGDP